MAQSETPTRQALPIIEQFQCAHTRMVGVAHAKAGPQFPELMLDLTLGPPLQSHQPSVCHNQDFVRKTKLPVQVNLKAGQRVF
jgi:hypothetical protein